MTDRRFYWVKCNGHWQPAEKAAQIGDDWWFLVGDEDPVHAFNDVDLVGPEIVQPDDERFGFYTKDAKS